MSMSDDDLHAILKRAFPQGTALLHHESGLELLHHGARTLIGTPCLAYEVLGAKTTAALSSAVRSLGERYIATAKELDALVAGDPSRPSRACSGASCSTEAET
jgi:hypothetical protein